uniref:Uncharacterized protein n=1 Tax=Romanomermis culicivorax TaxID=13658 RepID=A0A915HEX6_ROMCU
MFDTCRAERASLRKFSNSGSMVGSGDGEGDFLSFSSDTDPNGFHFGLKTSMNIHKHFKKTRLYVD